MSISIVIPIADIRPNNKQDLEELLDSIEPEKFAAVVCCYDSCEEEFIEYFSTKYGFTHSLINRGNRLNFSRNSNVGLRWARKEVGGHIMLVNQDCILPSYDLLAQIPGEGLSSPKSSPTLDGPNTGSRTRLTNAHFPFYAPCFSEKVIDKVGFLAEPLKKLFSDDDYCARVLLEGSCPLEMVDITINHKGSHIDTSQEWESRSGTYNQNDLTLGLDQYRKRWNLMSTSHDAMIKTILEKYRWTDKMRQL